MPIILAFQETEAGALEVGVHHRQISDLDSVSKRVQWEDLGLNPNYSATPTRLLLIHP